MREDGLGEVYFVVVDFDFALRVIILYYEKKVTDKVFFPHSPY